MDTTGEPDLATRWEVQDAVFASRMDPAGRHLMHALIAKATGTTVTVPVDHAPNYDALAEMTGLSRSTVSEWMKALAAGGWFSREGGTTRAAGGYALAVGDPDVRLPKRASRISKKPISPLSGLKPEAVEGDLLGSDGVALPRPADQSQAVALSSISPPGGVKQSAERTNDSPLGGLKPDAPIRNLPTGDAVPPSSPSSPSPGAAPVNEGPASLDDWRASDRKTAPPTVVAPNPPRAGKQTAMIAKPKRMSERVEIVYDWLRTNGHPEVTPEDAVAVHASVTAAYGSKVTPGYLRRMASVDGGGFDGFYADLRRRRGEETDRLIRSLERTRPDCEHGTAAGQEPHPIHGTPLCPQCRAAAPAVEDADTPTAPEVAAALNAYHAGHRGAFATLELVQVAQQAEALRKGGATAEQLAELARTAAANDTDLFTAATSRRDA